jgi:hypothetical protein
MKRRLEITDVPLCRLRLRADWIGAPDNKASVFEASTDDWPPARVLITPRLASTWRLPVEPAYQSRGEVVAKIGQTSRARCPPGFTSNCSAVHLLRRQRRVASCYRAEAIGLNDQEVHAPLSRKRK